MIDTKFSEPDEFSPESTPKSIGIPRRIAQVLGLKGTVIAVVLLFVGVFCLQNIESTSVQFLFWKILEVPKLYLVIISMFLGAMIGLLFGWKFWREGRLSR